MIFVQRAFQYFAVGALVWGTVACGANNRTVLDAPTVDMTATAASALIAAALDTPTPAMNPTTAPTDDVAATGTALAAQVAATLEAQFAATLTAVAAPAVATAAAAATHSAMMMQTAEAISTTMNEPSVSSIPVQPVVPSEIPEPLAPEATVCELPADLVRIAAHEQARLGCPIRGTVKTTVTVEEFMKGRLLWVEAQDRIYALTTDRVMPVGGHWTSHSNGWTSQMPSLPCPEAEHFGYPAMGFGLLWCNDAGVRRLLGEPLGPERPIESSQLQQFEGGLLLNYSNGSIDILFGDGKWTSK
jgi:hypothetical protein